MTAMTVLDPLDLRSNDRPVVAIVDINHPADTVLAQSAFAGQALGCSVKLVLLVPRVGFSSDAALVARAHHRVREECDKVLAALRQQVPHLAGPAELVWYARTPLGKPAKQAYRAAQRAIRRYDGHAVVLPPHLRTASHGNPTRRSSHCKTTDQ